MSSAPLRSKGWVIGINVPEEEEALLARKLELKNCAVATSGDVYQFILHNGKNTRISQTLELAMALLFSAM